MDSFDIPHRWHLGSPQPIFGSTVEPATFLQGKPIAEPVRLLIPVTEGKHPLDFTFAAFDVPVVTHRIAELIATICPNEVQLVEILISTTNEIYRALNLLHIVPALDEDRSEISRWTEEDNSGEQIGSIFAVSKIVLNASGLRNTKIFRLRGWEVPILIREDVRDALLAADVSGIDFELLEV